MAEVPIVPTLSTGAPTTARRIAALSVWGSKIPRESAFCSHWMLQSRRTYPELGRKISKVIFPANNNEITSNSSDSQWAYKFADDSPDGLRIING
jgi:hypothetical protein